MKSWEVLYWQSWVETFTTERMWRVWRMAFAGEWQGPLYPPQVQALIDVLQEMVDDHA